MYNPQDHVQWPNLARDSLLIRTVGVSSYDSLQVKFQRRYHKGLQFLTSYTLSEAKSNAGDSLSGGNLGDLRAPDVVGLGPEERHRSRRHSTRSMRSCSAEVTTSRDSGAILGGWQTHWVVSIYSGQPQTVNCTPVDRCGHSLLRADRRRSVRPRPDRGSLVQPGGICQSPLAVATIGQTDFSPLGGTRGHLIGPGLKQLDIGFGKQIPIGRSRRLEIRGEAFNVTNTPAFQQPGNASLNFRHAKLRHDHGDAQHAAPNPDGRKDILVGSRLGLYGSPRAGDASRWREERPRPRFLRPLWPTEIEQRLTEAVRAAPDSFKAHHALAVFYLQQGDVKAAIPHLRRAYAIDPAHYDNGYNFALALLQIGGVDEARGIVTQLLKREGDRRASQPAGRRGGARGKPEQCGRALSARGPHGCDRGTPVRLGKHPLAAPRGRQCADGVHRGG